MTNYLQDKEQQDWSESTKELLDTLPQIWTRGLLYFLGIFLTVVIPWAIFAKIDETGTARGRLEPQEETVKLDAAITGTVAEIRVKEGDLVQQGQILLTLESDLVRSELQQEQERLEGQINRLNQVNLLKSQLNFALSIQQQQKQEGASEKQNQVSQAQENLDNL